MARAKENKEGTKKEVKEVVEEKVDLGDKSLEDELKNLEVKPDPTEEANTDKVEEKLGKSVILEEPPLIPVAVTENDPIRSWKKVGGGSFQLGQEYIKPNQKFQARESQIPKNFRDVVIPLDVIPKAEVKIQLVPVVYTLEPAGENLFHILDSLGKRISQVPLEKDKALSFMTALQS